MRLRRLVDWSYTDGRHMWLRSADGSVTESIHSGNGVRQGCWLGALLFAVSMKEIFDNIQMNNHDVSMVAIMYDLYFLRKPAACPEAYKQFAEASLANGSFDVNHSKGQYMSFHDTSIPPDVKSELVKLKL